MHGRGVFSLAIFVAACSSAVAAEVLTGPQLTELLAGGKTVHLGGPGTGYSGDLVLSPDGTGSGSATTDDKKKIKLQGTWKIKDDTFCRTWKGIDKGKEVCETWLLVEPSKVKVFLEIGTNWWD
jgi:hypothetical protein